MIDRLETMVKRYDEINNLLSQPEIATDIKKMTELNKELRSLDETVTVYKRFKDVDESISECKEMLSDSDEDIVEMARVELEELEPLKVELEEELTILLLPKDPNDEKNVIVEIRGAAGGLPSP